MKSRTILSCLLFMLIIAGCNDKDEFEFTGETGRPSSFGYPDKSDIFIHYEGTRISEIISKEGGKTTFVYENGTLDHLSFSPPEGMMDGHGSTSFKREGNKIRVESWGEPATDVLYVEEIELDENDLPVRIDEVGIYKQTREGLIKQDVNMDRYTLISLDPVTKNLLEIKVMEKKSNEILIMHNYEYDNKPGAMNKIDAPLWFWVYWNHLHSELYSLHTRVFLNYMNNVIKETVTGSLMDIGFNTINYEYRYDEDDYPSIISNDYPDPKSITIRY